MEFKWLNESTVKQSGDRIEILAPGKTDFFCGSMDECQEGILPESLCNAPYYYTEVEGDFVLRVKVSHGFQETYDSASVMVMKDLNCWAKCCFELTDFGTHAAVSVVTKGDSDDANGCNLKGNTAWLQDLTFQATLEYIAPKSTEDNGANQFEIKAAVSVPDTVVIRSGYSANGEIVLERASQALAIPEGCVEFKDDSTFVYVLTDSVPQQVFRRQPIEVGMSDGIQIAVKSGITDKDLIRNNTKNQEKED